MPIEEQVTGTIKVVQTPVEVQESPVGESAYMKKKRLAAEEAALAKGKEEPSEISQALELLKEFGAKFNALDERLKKVETISGAVGTEPPREKVSGPVSADQNEIVDEVNRILGEGFTVEMKKHSATSFMLECTAPQHLQENAGEKRHKVIPYAEGVEGARMAAEFWRDNLIRWANAHGQTYKA